MAKKETVVETKAEETPVAEVAEEVAEEAAPETPAVDERDTELARLRAENETLKTVRPAQPQVVARPQITSSDLSRLSDQEWADIEEKTGKNRDVILAGVRSQEAERRSLESEARWRVAEALDDAVEKDPQIHKLKVHMREYLSDIPLEDRADADKLKRHMDKAKVFARGRLAEKGISTRTTTVGAAPKGSTMKAPTPSNDEGDDEGLEEGEVKAGSEVMIGPMKLKIKDLPEKLQARAKELRHPDDPNGVMFKNYDKAPKFNRGG